MGPVTGAKEPGRGQLRSGRAGLRLRAPVTGGDHCQELVRRGTGNAVADPGRAVNGDLHATGACERGAEQGRQSVAIRCYPGAGRARCLPGRIAGGTQQPGHRQAEYRAAAGALPGGGNRGGPAIQCTATGSQRIGAPGPAGATPRCAGCRATGARGLSRPGS